MIRLNLLVVGTGYVGLVSAACYAYMGHSVTCMDIDKDKIDRLKRGECPIHEAGLSELLDPLREKMIFATEPPQLPNFDIALLAVGTPPLDNGAPDLRFLFSAVDDLARFLPKDGVLAIKSTVPVGTASRIERRLARLGREDIVVVSFPEFLREGTAVHDTLHPTRVVFGVENVRARDTLRQLHAGMEVTAIECDRRTAEMIKYSSNAFLATKISFINEIANICAKVGADVSVVAEGMGLDPRIGNEFLRPGLGYGGSCFPKDTRALVKLADDIDYDFRVLKSVIEINQRQRTAPLRALREWFPDLDGVVVVLLGVAFKPGTDDIRESPALDLAWELAARGVKLRFCDPVVGPSIQFDDAPVAVERDPYTALDGADAAVLVTEWKEYADLDWNRIRGLMARRYLYDGRNLWNPGAVREAGFILENVGRGILRG
ncbi:MAG: UDP-glucose dehydrogenase family protein [Bacilli bacterium]